MGAKHSCRCFARRLPILFRSGQWLDGATLLNHSGGTVPDSHRFLVTWNGELMARIIPEWFGCQEVRKHAALENQPKHGWNGEHRNKRTEHDNRRGKIGILAILLGQDEIDNRRWQTTIKQKHLPVDALGADQIDGEERCRGTAKDPHQCAAERVAPLDRPDIVQAITEAHEQNRNAGLAQQ